VTKRPRRTGNTDLSQGFDLILHDGPTLRSTARHHPKAPHFIPEDIDEACIFRCAVRVASILLNRGGL